MEESLFEKIILKTGLPEDLISKELASLLENAGVDKNQVTMEQLREVLSTYLQDVLLNAKETSL